MPYTYVLLLFFTLSTTWYFILFLRLSKGALSRAKMYDISTYLHVDPKILIKIIYMFLDLLKVYYQLTVNILLVLYSEHGFVFARERLHDKYNRVFSFYRQHSAIFI